MDLTEFLASLRGWTGYKNPAVHSDALLTSWLRMGEERVNMDLRIADMVQIDTATIYQNRVATPADWIANDYLRFVDGKGIRYLSIDEFYDEDSPKGSYTTSGKFLMIGGDIDQNEGLGVELHYFGNIPQLTGAATWFSTKHVSLLTSAAMTPASIHLQEEGRAGTWELNTSSTIAKLNDIYNTKSAKSGPVIQRKRGFRATSSVR